MPLFLKLVSDHNFGSLQLRLGIFTVAGSRSSRVLRGHDSASTALVQSWNSENLREPLQHVSDYLPPLPAWAHRRVPVAEKEACDKVRRGYNTTAERFVFRYQKTSRDAQRLSEELCKVWTLDKTIRTVFAFRPPSAKTRCSRAASRMPFSSSSIEARTRCHRSSTSGPTRRWCTS